MTRKQTYIQVRDWLAEIKQIIGINIPFVLIGNKVDLIKDADMVVDQREAQAFVNKEGGIYIETSTKTGINVDEAFSELTKRIIDSRNPK